MDKQEYEKFLLEIADKVEELVAVPEKRKRFEQHSRDLGKKQAAYSQASKRADKQMPAEPLSGFLSVLAYEADEPPQPNIDEALAYYYFSLATIHDKMREEYIPIHNDTYAKQLANTGVWPIIENLCVDKQFIIKTALDHVMADLAGKKPAKIQQSQRTEIPSEIKLLEQVAGELERWEKKYLPENAQTGKIELVEIVESESLKNFIGWLEWCKHQVKAEKIKTECTKILRWFHTENGVLSKNLDDNPFVADEKGFRLQLTDLLRSIEENIKADFAPEQPAETKGDTTPAKIINIESFKGVLGDVQAENVQTGDYSSIHKHSEERNKRKVKAIVTIVGFLAALLTCLYLLWWLWTNFLA